MTSLYADLAKLIKSPRGRRIVLYRNAEEQKYLEDWLSSGNGSLPAEISATAAIPAVNLLDKCDLCPSATGRKKSAGNGANGVMILLNAPALLQRREMDLFRRESADLLKNMITATGLKLEECYLTNLIKCDSCDPVVRPSDMLANCLNVFRQELEKVKPGIVIVMGDIKGIQRIVNESEGIHWYTIHHPVTIVKNPELKRPAWNTLQLVIDRLKES